MIHEPELAAIEARAHDLRLTMSEVCRRAGRHRSSWFKARQRGSASYVLVDPIERVLLEAEIQRDKLREHMHRAAEEAWRE